MTDPYQQYLDEARAEWAAERQRNNGMTDEQAAEYRLFYPDTETQENNR